MKRILVTGSNGFIGKHLCSYLEKHNCEVIRVFRSGKNGSSSCHIRDLDEDFPWEDLLKNVDSVVHLAARVHQMNEAEEGPIIFEKYFQTNVLGTQKLAEACVKSQVKKFIYISSIKVNGEGQEQPYNEESLPNPIGPYGVSKLAAEKILSDIALKSEMEVIILRPPLVYGPGVKGNFQTLMNFAKKRIPLPLKSIKNKRSLIYVLNLADCILSFINSGKKINYGTYLVSDGGYVSTSEIVDGISNYISGKSNTFHFPPFLMKFMASLLGKRDTFSKIAGDLYIDSKKIREELNWNPPFTFQEGIRQSVKFNEKT